MNVNRFFCCAIIVTLIFVFAIIACVATSLSGVLQDTLSASAVAAAAGLGLGGLFSNYLDISEGLEPLEKKKKKNATQGKDTKNKETNGSKNKDPKKKGPKDMSNTKNKIRRINNRKGGPKSRFRSSAKSFGKSRHVRGTKNVFRKSHWRIKRTMTRVRSGGRFLLRGGLRMLNPLLLLL